ncbi:MAG: hypothetical protein PVS3B3_36650 [Ktedonobacteraceae bacterium]
MHNDSLETLLARHYGSSAVAPTGLEQRLHASVHRQAARLARERSAATSMETHRVSRRRAVQLVALGSLGVSIVNLGLEVLETTLVGQETVQNAAMP